MKVTLLHHYRDADGADQLPGDTIDVTDEEGARLIRGKRATAEGAAGKKAAAKKPAGE